jgi:hypothetical protein
MIGIFPKSLGILKTCPAFSTPLPDWHFPEKLGHFECLSSNLHSITMIGIFPNSLGILNNHPAISTPLP